MEFTRRQALTTIAASSVAAFAPPATAMGKRRSYALSTFSADVTPPISHPLLAGWREPAKVIKEPLSARGLVLWGVGKPLVLCAVDWCELRNEAYDRWRDALADAIGTDRQRVLVHCLHQHDAPYADLEGQRLLDRHGLPEAMFDPEFHEQTVQRVATAAAEGAKAKRTITHFGAGEAKVEKVASNRRVELNGRVRFNRYSLTRDPEVRQAPEGEIDPFLKTLSFFDGEKPVAAVSCYAVHPMSYYGRGEVSYDFVGMARQQRQRDDGSIFQIYLSGCAGDVTAARYNDGTEAGRAVLADRIYEGMKAAWKATERKPLDQIHFRLAALKFKPREEGDFAPQAAEKVIADADASKKSRIQAALTLSWHKRVASGQPIDLPAIDFGSAQLVLLPAESFVGYQLAAQQIRPDGFVVTPAYGECAPGYIPTDRAEREGFVSEHGYDWVAPMPENTMMAAIKDALAT